LVRRGLLDLHARHSALELELLGSNAVVDLTRGDADIALRVTKVDQPSLRVRRVARLPFAAFASESYVKRRGRPRAEHELTGHDVLVHAGELAKLPEARWLTSRSGVRVVLRSNSMIALLTALADGAGVSVMSGSGVEEELGLVRLFDVPAIAPRTLFLAMHPDAAARTAVRIVADHIADVISRGRTRVG
jgi:DNA-binding transcriptional LysR family regulator